MREMASTVVALVTDGYKTLTFSTTPEDEQIISETLVRQEVSEGILSLEEYRRFVYIVPAFYFLLAPLGITTNIVNLQCFLKLGIADSVSVTMFCLSLSDFLLSISQFITGCGSLFVALEQSGATIFSADPFIIISYCGPTGINCYTSTTLITTYLAVTRCACVVQPLRFKSMFTVKRTVPVLTLFLLFPHALYIAAYAGTKTVMGFDSKFNVSRVVRWEAEGRRVTLDVIHFIINLLIPFSCQVIVLISLIFLVAGLKSTSAFRRSVNAPLESKNETRMRIKFWKKSQSTASPKQADPARSCQEVMEKSANSRKDKALRGKELRVARQVILISVVFIVTNTPAIVRSAGQLAVEEFSIGRTYHNIYQISSHAIVLSSLLNGGTSLFIYLKFNTAFRNIIYSLKTQ